MILTLQDKGVLDEDEDVLVNVNMLDDERYKKVKLFSIIVNVKGLVFNHSLN